MVAREESVCRDRGRLSSVVERWSLPGLGEHPVAQIAKDLGISESCLRNWMAQADVDEGQPAGGPPTPGPISPAPAGCVEKDAQTPPRLMEK
jgi:transposase-like protein